MRRRSYWLLWQERVGLSINSIGLLKPDGLSLPPCSCCLLLPARRRNKDPLCVNGKTKGVAIKKPEALDSNTPGWACCAENIRFARHCSDPSDGGDADHQCRSRCGREWGDSLVAVDEVGMTFVDSPARDDSEPASAKRRRLGPDIRVLLSKELSDRIRNYGIDNLPIGGLVLNPLLLRTSPNRSPFGDDAVWGGHLIPGMIEKDDKGCGRR